MFGKNAGLGWTSKYQGSMCERILTMGYKLSQCLTYDIAQIDKILATLVF